MGLPWARFGGITRAAAKEQTVIEAAAEA